MNEEKQENPKHAIMIAYVNGDGWIVDFKAPDGKDLDRERDYDDPEKTIPGNARLMTQNYCCWKLVYGRWKCVPC